MNPIHLLWVVPLAWTGGFLTFTMCRMASYSDHEMNTKGWNGGSADDKK